MSTVFYWRDGKIGDALFECVQRETIIVAGKIEKDTGSFFWVASVDSGREPTTIKAARRVMDTLRAAHGRCIFRQLFLLADHDAAEKSK